MSSLIPRNSQRVIVRATGCLLLGAALLLGGCQQQNPRTEIHDERELKERLAPLELPDGRWSGTALKQTGKSSTVRAHPGVAEEDTPAISDIWQRIRHGYQLLDEDDSNPRIEQQRLWFASRTASLEQITRRSTPYIHYIVEALDSRNMPLELALLPVIESAYNPLAYSPSHASGLWQFIPSTGRNFKLKQTRWYDGRNDIMASTEAALNYLQYLNRMFDGDWLLALAAYNSGEGTVSRAIKRNRDLGLPADYWNLQLPAETRDYIPKLLGLAQLIASPEAYALNLPDVPDEPYFIRVPLKRQLDLKRIAVLADISDEHIRELNPAFKQGVTLDGPLHVLVPAEQAGRLKRKLAELKHEELPVLRPYVVRQGDTLSGIAQRHGSSVSAIRQLNQLKSNQLRIGQQLSIPGPTGLQATLASAAPAPLSRTHKVGSGDTLSGLAVRYGVTAAQLRAWNQLSSDRLKVGQTLRIQADTTRYVVRAGDTLSTIARKHKVSIRQLENWNPSRDKLLKPGQTLTLYL